MEVGGALERLREFQLTEMASDVAERRVGRKRLRVEAGNGAQSDGVTCKGRCVQLRSDGDRDVGGGRSWLIPLCLELGAIFRREDLSALQIFVGVNVLGLFLLRLFAGAFLLGGFRDILGEAMRGIYHDIRKNQKRRKADTNTRGHGLRFEEATCRHWGCHIR